MRLTFTAKQVFQLDVYAKRHGFDGGPEGALTAPERAVVATLRAEREICAAHFAAYVLGSGGRFADGSPMFSPEGRKLTTAERTGVSLYVATHGNNRETFTVDDSADHSAHAGLACLDDGTGGCAECGVALVRCDACGGVGYHAAGCADGPPSDDAAISSLLCEDLDEQLSLDAARVYDIERALRASMPPVARLALQRERAQLMVAS